MKKEDIVLKKGDVAYYTNISGTNSRMMIDGYDGATVKEFKKELRIKLIKVERPIKYETIYEAPKPILDKEEKEYLEAVLRPFRNKIKYVKKTLRLSTMNQEYLFIEMVDDHVYLPYFDEKKMYKGMVLGKEYTLEELGLFEG